MKEEKVNIKDSLEALLKSEDAPNEISTNEGVEVIKNTIAPDFVKIKTSSRNKAVKLMDSLLKFYLSEEFIDQNEYITAKINLDKLSLEGLIKQIQLADIAIENMLIHMDSGDVQPKMFEMFSMLQRTYIELVKTQTLYLISTEEHIKKLKNDYDYFQNKNGKKTGAFSNLTITEEGMTTRGTKDMLRSMMDDDEIENEIEDIEENED